MRGALPMKRAIWCVVLVLGVACGSSNKATHPSCTSTGTACSTNNECCTGNCDSLVGLCSHVAGQCLMSGASCSVGPDCCSFACTNFKCSGNQSKYDGSSCGFDG